MWSCWKIGQVGVTAAPASPGYTRARFTVYRFTPFDPSGADVTDRSITNPSKQFAANVGDIGQVFGYDPSSTAFYYQCDGGFLSNYPSRGPRYALYKASDVSKENCTSKAANQADNTKVADPGSGANQVGKALGGMTFDSSGNVYLSDQSNDRVAKWTTANTTGGGTGTTIAGTGTAGSALNQLNNPGQIVFDSSGNLYVADSGNNRVLKFPAGSTSGTNGTVVAGGNGAGSDPNQLSKPLGVAVDGDGAVYVADTENCRVVKWPSGATAGTTLVGQYGCTAWGQLTYPTQLAINPTDQRLYIDAPSVNKEGWGASQFGFFDLATQLYSQLWSTTGTPSIGYTLRGFILDKTGTPTFRTGDDIAVDGANNTNGGGLARLGLGGGTFTCDISIPRDYVNDPYAIGPQAQICRGPMRYLGEMDWGDVVFYNASGEGVHLSWGAFVSSHQWTVAPNAPAKPTLKAKYKAIEVNWKPATTGDPASSYLVTMKDSKGATVGTCTADAPSTSCVVNGLDPKVKYTATVVGKNPKGDSKASASSSPGSPYDLPAAPAAPVGAPLARSAKVSFSAPSTANGGPALSYTVTAGPGGATCTVDAPATNCVVPGLTPGTHYTFTVEASNEGGAGPASPASNDTVPFDNPSKPSKPTLTAGDAGVVVKGSSSASDGGSAITSYTATVYDPNGDAVGTCDYVDPSIGCALPGLSNGVAYTAKVVAHNAGGDSVLSDPSSSATPAGPPSSPPNLKVTSTGDATVDLSWDAPALDGGSSISGYVLDWFGHDGSCTVDSSARTAHCTGLTNGTGYSFTVAAGNGSGPGPVSSAVIGKPMTTPSVPLAPTVKAGNGTVTVTWKKPASDGGSAITAYTVTVGGKTCVTTGTSCTITGLTNGSAVTAVVKASNKVGDSADSAASTSATPAAVAGAPNTAPFSVPQLTAEDGTLTASLSDFQPGVTGVVFTAGPGGQSCVAKTMPYRCTLPGVDNGTAYTVTAAWMNAKGTGPQGSASNAATPKGPPSAPQQLSISGSNGTMKVSWNPPASTGGSSVTSYTVTVKDSKGKVAGTCTYEVASPETDTCTVSGLSTSEVYSVEATATNDVGTGPKGLLADVLSPIAFNSLTAPSAKLQVAVGDHGQALRSFDGGAHWIVDSSPTLENLRGVACGGGGTFCMAVGDNGTVLTWDAASDTGNAVKSWKPISSGTTEELNGVACIMDGACLAVGNGSSVVISDPQPAKAAPTTVKVNVATEVFGGGAVNAVACTNPKAPAKPVCVIGGSGGKLVSVKWQGASSGFSGPTVMTVKGATTDITALRCSVDTNCVAVGKSGLVLSGTKEISKAASWKKLGTIKGFDATKDLRGVACPALSQLCVAVGNSGTLLLSNPKKPVGPGSTGWVPLTSKVAYDLTNVRCISQTACLGIGGGHLIQVVQAKSGKWAVRQVA